MNNKMKILVTGGSGFIGTNYIEMLSNTADVEFLNLDKRMPRNKKHERFWKECNILDADQLRKIIKDFSPTHIVHLAAQTGTDIKNLEAFAANIEGVKNVLLAAAVVPSVKHIIFTSSLLVCKMGYVPKHDTDYQPSTMYGESKVRGEKIVRTAKNLPYAWTIIRPISIWGPWFAEPYKNFFKAIGHGWYFHIGSGHYKRSLGYVENTVHQIHQLLIAPLERTNKKTFYVADDQPADLYEIANIIRETIGARKIYHIPFWLANAAALFGDICKTAGWHNVPLTSFRLNNILTEYIFNMTPIMQISGPLPYDLRTGIGELFSGCMKWERSNYLKEVI